VKILRQLTFI